jgi:hypothetical protein
MTFLSGCATRVSSPDLEIYCPPIITYSDNFNEKLLGELQASSGNGDAIVRALNDYIALRDKVKLCYREREKYATE